MQITIYYESWQMDCCGTPFAIGDTVKWDCVKSDDDWIIKADYYYEAHEKCHFIITGKVAEIYGVNCEYEQRDDGMFYPIAYQTTPIQQVKEFMTDVAESGFLVILDNPQIQTA